MKHLVGLIFCFAFYAFPLSSNNLLINNCSLISQNSTAGTIIVKFDISWDNSWRVATAPDNWDAAWTFVKYKIGSNGSWNHATLNLLGHNVPAGCTFSTPTDGKGSFLYRNANGTGNVSWPGVELLWNYGVDGVANTDSVEICVFGIEMVYVSQDTFYLGDGSSTNPYGQFRQGGSNVPLLISSEASITLGGSASSNLMVNSSIGDDFNSSSTQTLPAAFPKGYDAIYCMKYEVTQGQYSDFLNKLDPAQATARYPGFNGSFRHTILLAAGIYSASAPHRACNYLGWDDAAAFADWAALRPMTETEYEKICRGPLVAVPNEYSWGSAAIVQATGVANLGTATETASNAGANCVNNNGVSGPLRVGCFAGVATTRVQAGAAYYGAMDMTGNNWERVVSIGNSQGRAFTGNNGDGIINAAGNANTALWPANGTGLGSGIRGGDWGNTGSEARLSDRKYAVTTYNARGSNVSFRGVRKAP